MIYVNGREIKQSLFPDGTFNLKLNPLDFAPCKEPIEISWYFENNSELVCLYMLTKHLQKTFRSIILNLAYLPNARQDRVKNPEDVFSLKYFCEIINSLNYERVNVLDVHSNVSLALLERVQNELPLYQVYIVLKQLEKEKSDRDQDLILFYPDEKAEKRYGDFIKKDYCFGIKDRNWLTGKIESLKIFNSEKVKGKNVLIVDDICSKGTFFYYAATALKKAGAKKVYLYVSHLEKTVLEGKLQSEKLIEKIYTTSSLTKTWDISKSKIPIEVID